METVLVQINNSKVYKLLEGLEELHIIKLLKQDIQSQLKISKKYKNVFSAEDAKSFDEYTQATRKEWNIT